MIDLDDSPHRAHIMASFQAHVAGLAAKHRTVTAGLVEDLYELVHDYQLQCRELQIDFPRMGIIPLPSVNVCELVRLDSDAKDVPVHVMNIVTRNPSVDMVELAIGMKTVFPGYKPGNMH